MAPNLLLLFTLLGTASSQFPYHFLAPFKNEHLPFPIYCPGEAPAGPYGYKSNKKNNERWNETDFDNQLQNLCAFDSPQYVNFQGRCVLDPESMADSKSPSDIRFKKRFSTGLAEDNGLFDADLLSKCEEGCSCRSLEDMLYALDLKEAQRSWSLQKQQNQKKEEKLENEVEVPLRPIDSIASSRGQNGEQQVCTSSSCVNYRCSTTSNDNNRRSRSCQCVAERASTGIYRVAGCRSQARIGGPRMNGRRNTETLGAVCPCNQTYVSEGCCDAVDNLVWESAAKKLGVLDEIYNREDSSS